MKTIYILLTRSGTVLSRAIYCFTRDPYTHVSISFDRDLQPLYSSGRKNGDTMFPAGPCMEVFHRGFYLRNRHIPCALYALSVPEERYEAALAQARYFADNAQAYHFNLLGIALCKLGIPFHPRNAFFCSQFVGEILRRSNALPLPRDTSLLRPMDYTTLPQLHCIFRGSLADLVPFPEERPKHPFGFGKETVFALGNLRNLWYTLR